MAFCHRVLNRDCPENSPCLLSNCPNLSESTPPRSKCSRKRQITELVVAIAEGTPVAEWATKNNVPRRTAYRWARQPKVRAKVEAYRRRVLDQAVGRMTSNVNWATDGIAELAQGAASESVKLSALRAVMSDMMAVSKFGGLEDRVTQIEEKVNARTGNTRRAH